MVCLETLIVSLLNRSLLLNRMHTHLRAWPIVFAIFPFLFSVLLAAQQSPQPASPVTATLQFATITPSAPNSQGHRFRVTGHLFETTNTSLLDLIAFAYGLHATQILGAPDWAQQDKFDLTLQADPESKMTESLWTRMLQVYLTESCKLSFHRNTKDLPVYVLAIGRSAPKLTASHRDPKQLPEFSITLGATNAANANLAAISATNATMTELAGVLQRVVLEWPVVDQTGMTGRYDFAVTWTPDGAQFGDARARIPAPIDVANAPPYLASALQQQVGLTLDLLEAPLQILVIDYVERPAENVTRALRHQDGRLPGLLWRSCCQSP